MTRKPLAWNVRQVCTMIDRGTITFNNPIQRPSGQWKQHDQSLLIHSILTMFIPDIYAIQIRGEKANTYDIIDGRQRLTAIYSFLKDEWALTELEPVKLESTGEEYDISGLKFSELPEEVQEEIKGYTITFKAIEFDPDDDQEEIIDDIFYRLNNGKPVTRGHLAYVSASRKVQEFIQKQITENPLFTEVAHFSEGSIKRSDREVCILQSIMLSTGMKYKSFSNRDVEEFFTNNTNIDDELFNRLESTFVEIAETFNFEHDKFANKVNIPAMVGAFNACGGSADCTERVQKAIAGYVPASKPGDKYRQYTGAGCQKKENVQGRVKALIEICGNGELAEAV
jgi:hypothetical protein